MIEQRPGPAEIGICAALGSALAGATLGVWIAISWLDTSDGLAEMIPMFGGLALVGTIAGLVIGGPIGFVVGLVISRFVGTSIAHGALAGALTGAAYPLFFLVAGAWMGDEGLSTLAGSFALFMGLGAVCGAVVHWKVIGNTAQ